jgi:hypothetical protein
MDAAARQAQAQARLPRAADAAAELPVRAYAQRIAEAVRDNVVTVRGPCHAPAASSCRVRCVR